MSGKKSVTPTIEKLHDCVGKEVKKVSIVEGAFPYYVMTFTDNSVIQIPVDNVFNRLGDHIHR